MQYLLDLIRTTRVRHLLLFSGYALYLVYSFMVVHSATLFSAAEGLTAREQTLFWLVHSVANVAFFAIIACLPRLIMRIPVMLLAVVAGAVALMSFLVMSMLFQFLGLVPENAFMAWLWVAAALLGLGNVLVLLLWARFSASLNARTVYLYILLCNVLSLIIYFAVTFVPSGTSLPLAALLFLISALFAVCALAARTEQRWEYSAPAFGGAVRDIAQPLIGAMVLFFMSGLMQQISQQREMPLADFQYISLLSTAAVVLCLLLPALLIKRPLEARRLYSLAIPLSAAGFLLLPLIWNTVGGITNSFAQLGSMVAALVLWCLVAEKTASAKLPPLQLFALTLGAIEAAHCTGTVVGILNADTLQRDTLLLTTVALVAAYLLFMVALFVLRDRGSRASQSGTSMPQERGSLSSAGKMADVGEHEVEIGRAHV